MTCRRRSLTLNKRGKIRQNSCRKILFAGDIKTLIGKDDDDAFLLYFYYNSILVEERTETLIYGLVDVMAAAGGHLGLCLGFSCLTLFWSLLEWIELRLGKLKLY